MTATIVFVHGRAQEGKDPARLPLGVLRFACVTDSKAEAREFAENARWQLRLAGALRRREEAMEGHMLIEKPGPNEPTLEQIQAQGLPEEWKDWGSGFIDTKTWIATVYGSLEASKKNPGGSTHH